RDLGTDDVREGPRTFDLAVFDVDRLAHLRLEPLDRCRGRNSDGVRHAADAAQRRSDGDGASDLRAARVDGNGERIEPDVADLVTDGPPRERRFADVDHDALALARDVDAAAAADERGAHRSNFEIARAERKQCPLQN